MIICQVIMSIVKWYALVAWKLMNFYGDMQPSILVSLEFQIHSNYNIYICIK